MLSDTQWEEVCAAKDERIAKLELNRDGLQEACDNRDKIILKRDDKIEELDEKLGLKAHENLENWKRAEAAEAKVKELEAILNRNNPWSLRDVLRKLALAADILLHEKDYDGHGYEEIVEAREVGRTLAMKIDALGSADADSTREVK